MVIKPRRSRGFSLVEILIVIAIMGIMAKLTMSHFFKVVERGRIAEMKTWVITLRGAQERRVVRSPYTYYSGPTPGPSTFDVNLGTPKYYIQTGNIQLVSGGRGWTVGMTRNAPCPSFYGCYVVNYNSVTSAFTSGNANVTRDLIP